MDMCTSHGVSRKGPPVCCMRLYMLSALYKRELHRRQAAQTAGACVWNCACNYQLKLLADLCHAHGQITSVTSSWFCCTMLPLWMLCIFRPSSQCTMSGSVDTPRPARCSMKAATHMNNTSLCISRHLPLIPLKVSDRFLLQQTKTTASQLNVQPTASCRTKAA